MKVKTNLVKWFLQLSKLLRELAENAKARRLVAITSEQDVVLEKAIKRKEAIEKELLAMIKTAERSKEKASEEASKKHKALSGEQLELEGL